MHRTQIAGSGSPDALFNPYAKWVVRVALRGDAPTDTELVYAAQSGDVRAIGLLIARYRPGMRVVALRVLGYGNDSDDAVQDAALIALRRIRDVRDPAAIGPWLYAVVRNVCRSRLRERTAIPFDDMDALTPPMNIPDPAMVLEGHAMRDWIWRAIENLSADQRLVTMLRYFTNVTSYEHIAQICGIPVGTVGSRLNSARVKLHESLSAAEISVHDDVAALNHTRQLEAVEILRSAEQGGFAAAGAEQFHASVETAWPQGHASKGFDLLAAAMNRDLTAGVRQRLTGVVASRDIIIWETDLISPPDDPRHCPPALVWVQFLRNGRAQRIRLFHAPRVADH